MSLWIISLSVTIQMKAIEHFSYGAFYYALQGCSNFEGKILNCDHSEMKATKQYLIVVVLFQY